MSKVFTFGRPSGGAASLYPYEPEAGELLAMQAGISELLEVLSWARPHGSEAELEFIKRHVLVPLKALGVPYQVDNFGNIWATIKPGDGYPGPAFLWSCHVDTVHSKGGRQAVRFQGDGRTIELTKGKPGRCLGADDGAGVWLLLEMIRAGVPGGYVFHRGEEKGRLGSEHVATNEPERLRPYDACVAFDRRGHSDFITHQMGLRCASDDFAKAMSRALNRAGEGLLYVPDDGGSYTDSYSYAGQISECANVACGYASEHGPRETLDALHVWRLRNAILAADFGSVPCVRDCTIEDYDMWGGYYGSGYGNVTGSWGSYPGSRTGDKAWADDLEDCASAVAATSSLVRLIERYPAAVADLLRTYGLGVNDVVEHMTEREIGEAAGAVCAGGWNHD